MKAVVMEKFGGKEVLQLKEIDAPLPGNHEVLIKVAYAGVNPVDWKIREGHLCDVFPCEFPLVPGWDLSGEIVQVGQNVKGLSTGDRVFAYIRKPTVHWGAYAEFATFNAEDVVKIPKELSLKEAAAMPLISLTAWQAIIDTVNIQKGQTILILNGSGGVGCMAIQFAKNNGARVFTTASKKKHAYVKQFKPDAIFDYHEEYGNEVRKLSPEGVDIIFDCIGGETMNNSLPLLRKGGTFVSIVDMEAVERAKKNGTRSHFVLVTPNGHELQTIANLISQKKIMPPKVEELSLKDAAIAQEKQREGNMTGKLVLKVAA